MMVSPGGLRVHVYNKPHRDETGKVVALRVFRWNDRTGGYDETIEPLVVGSPITRSGGCVAGNMTGLEHGPGTRYEPRG